MAHDALFVRRCGDFIAQPFELVRYLLLNHKQEDCGSIGEPDPENLSQSETPTYAGSIRKIKLNPGADERGNLIFEYKHPNKGLFVWSGPLLKDKNIENAKRAYCCIGNSLETIIPGDSELRDMWYCLKLVHRADILFARPPTELEKIEIAKRMESFGYRVEIRTK